MAVLISACSISAPDKRSELVSFKNPPAVGDWLKPQRNLIACKTRAAAEYMSNFGFSHPQCEPLTHIGEREFLVKKRARVLLPEGPIWLLEAHRNTPKTLSTDKSTLATSDELFYVPIPWHDWI